MEHRIRSLLIRPASDREINEHNEQWCNGELPPAGAYYTICTLVETDDSFVDSTETCHERELLIQAGQIIIGEIPELAFPKPQEIVDELARAQAQERGRGEEEVEAQAEMHKQELAPEKEDFDEEEPHPEEQEQAEKERRDGRANEDAEELTDSDPAHSTS